MGLDNLDRTEKGGLDQQFVVSCNRLINILPGESVHPPPTWGRRTAGALRGGSQLRLGIHLNSG